MSYFVSAIFSWVIEMAIFIRDDAAMPWSAMMLILSRQRLSAQEVPSLLIAAYSRWLFTFLLDDTPTQ